MPRNIFEKGAKRLELWNEIEAPILLKIKDVLLESGLSEEQAEEAVQAITSSDYLDNFVQAKIESLRNDFVPGGYDSMPRNMFENNKPEVSPEEALKLGDKLHAIMPHLAAGYRYELTQLEDGRTAVVVEETDTHALINNAVESVDEMFGTDSTKSDDELFDQAQKYLAKPERDRFGRKYAG